jgi:hypothetical protein
MAQAWHKVASQLAPGQGGPAPIFRATKYELIDGDNPASIRVAPGARWERFTPLASYRPTSKVREIEAGPHLKFLHLKGLMEQRSELFHTALKVFATAYGLLGAFEEDHLQRPVLPEGKNLVAPEAGIDNQGRLRRFEPGTEGKEILRAILEPRGWRFPRNLAADSTIALPSEMAFSAKQPDLDSEGWPTEPRQLVSWEKIRQDFGALLIADLTSWKGVSVLCTREPLRRWRVSLSFFPSGETPGEDLVSDSGISLNTHLQEVSPRVLLNQDGGLERGWHYRSLLQAMYVMLYLDLTGGNTIKNCESRGCPNYFRVGPQSKSRYCSERCANRASTRMRRGQEP